LGALRAHSPPHSIRDQISPQGIGVRGLTISAHGGLEKLELRDDLPRPEILRSTDVRVRVRAAAHNHLDLFVVGGLPGATIAPGSAVGSDGMGEVESIGAAVTGVAVGDMVMINPGVGCGICEYCLAGEEPLCVTFAILGEHRPGTLAEYVVVPSVNVARVPRDTPPHEAAAFPLATLTAWRMLTTRAVLKAG
jgi:NADPH:quinone reductase-like Zn-dependent oxidoreductase